ncbi:MAG TPA: phosphatase PAP2 family protein [Telluria sp.]
MIRSTFPRLHKFLAARLSPEGETGLHLTVGLVLIVGAAWVFGSIAGDVVANASITVLDVWLAHWFRANASESFTGVLLFITHWHSQPGIAAMALALGAWLYRNRAHYWLLALAATVPGGMLLNALLKYVFQRARPSWEDPLLSLSTYSFPSGHTAGATLFYGLLASYIVVVNRSWSVRAAAVAAACAMVALVALSRVYLGVHYLSDVLAAMAEGCAWLAVCLTAFSTLRRRRAARAEQ